MRNEINNSIAKLSEVVEIFHENITRTKMLQLFFDVSWM